MTTQPIRADWWREVTDPGYKFREGEPVRKEVNQYAEEYLATMPFEMHIATNVTYFIDTRWTPPRPAPKVGDVIETASDAKHLPTGSVFLDCDRDAWQIDDGIAYAAGGGLWFVDSDFDYLPITVIYVPKAGGGDE